MSKKITETVGKAMGKAHAVAARVQGDRGIFSRLQEEHAEVSVLMKRVSTAADENTRRALFPKIRLELLAHANAEELELYSLLELHDETRGMANHAKEQHESVERLLLGLQETHFASSMWRETFQRLVRDVERHVVEEEHSIFPKAKVLLDRGQSQKAAEAYVAAKKRAMDRLKAH